MRDLSSYASPGHPVYRKPFTVVDPQKAVWSAATDSVWFVAQQIDKPYQRLRASIDTLNTVLRLLKHTPVNPVSFVKAEVLSRFEAEGLARVLGVPVELRRLKKLIASFPAVDGVAWDSTEALGAPSIGLSCEGFRAYLAGFNSAGEPAEFSLVNPDELRFEALMALGDD